MTKQSVYALTTLITLAVLVGVFAWLLSFVEPATPVDRSEEVSALVEEFGGRLKMVSFLAPQSDVVSAMDQNYGPYVSPELLSEWKNNPAEAPGRQVSSPYPDRIEVVSVIYNPDGKYEVQGRVIDGTASYLVTIEVVDQKGTLRIISYQHPFTL